MNWNGVTIMKNNQMKAVHDDDLDSLLKSLNVFDSVCSGKYECLFCHKKITVDNIDAIVPYENSIQFTCDSPECHLKLIGLGK